VAVPVESFDEYRRLFGLFEGPGLLPYAVASFFENGGVRAWVVRIVHQHWKPDGTPDDAANAARVAGSRLFTGPSGSRVPLALRGGADLVLSARNEGAWGNQLRASLSFLTRPLAFETAMLDELVLRAGTLVPAGTLLRLELPGGARVLRFVRALNDRWPAASGPRRTHAALDFPLPAQPVAAEIVEGALSLDDRDGRAERFEGLGLTSAHPRWLAAELYRDSELVYPDPSWEDGELDLNDPRLPAFDTQAFENGADEYEAIVPEDFFDDLDWTLGNPSPGAGIHALTHNGEVAQLVVPDLYSPGPLLPRRRPELPASMCGPTFERAVDLPPAPSLPPAFDADLLGLRLDPSLPGDLERITGLQERVVELADALSSFIVLLDVPPRLHERQILRWRSRFASTYAAAYHPWLVVTREDDGRDGLIRVPPCSVAAGIIAARELALGIPHGPANTIALGVVNVDEVVSPGLHDVLHQTAVNVYLRERDGVRLTAARTLSTDAAWRQLSVRRLMTMLRRTLDAQMQWAVFEPNGPALRADVRILVQSFLRRLWRQNAFKGATEDEAFFVHCDEEQNPGRVVDAGELVCEVGIAPAEPMEFLVLRIARGGDGTLRVEDRRV
jgi:hypothetical protein